MWWKTGTSYFSPRKRPRKTSASTTPNNAIAEDRPNSKFMMNRFAAKTTMKVSPIQGPAGNRAAMIPNTAQTTAVG